MDFVLFDDADLDWGGTESLQQKQEQEQEQEQEQHVPIWGAAASSHVKHKEHHPVTPVVRRSLESEFYETTVVRSSPRSHWQERTVKQEEEEEVDDDDNDADSFHQERTVAKVEDHRDSSGYDNVDNGAVATAAVHSGVDGTGLWKSWCHNYNSPQYACLDLLDNCFDATLRANFHGKISMNYLAPNNLFIINNSAERIKSLGEILTAYRSEKNSSATVEGGLALRKDAIGEYGVGLKQACATLSDVSIVLARNGNQFDVGIIAEQLQTKDTVYLPHFQFSVSLQPSHQLIEEELHVKLGKIMIGNPQVFNLVTASLGEGNHRTAVQKLVEQCKLMLLSDPWKHDDFVFQILMTDFKHSSSTRSDNGMMLRAARQFLEEIRELLPKQYINVPLKDFDFLIDNERVHFVYWQNRLVEMTKFEVKVPKETPVEELEKLHENWDDQGYKLSIYCGFDALRLKTDKTNKQTKTCQLCIYSRQSGRLIEVTEDARGKLGLVSSGVDFSQGLTVIIDDYNGELPLKPAKDGLTWSKEANGKIHERNLLAWAGAVGRMYWHHHAKLFVSKGPNKSNDFKTRLGNAVATFIQPIESRIQLHKHMAKDNIPLPEELASSLEKAVFTKFGDVNWQVHRSANSGQVKIMKKSKKEYIWPGPATVFKFDASHYPKHDESSLACPGEKRKVGRPPGTGRAPLLSQKRRLESLSSLGRRTSAGSVGSVGLHTPKDPRLSVSDDSSSGSEEEEQVNVIIASPSPAKKARTEGMKIRNSTNTAAAGLTRCGAVASVADDTTGDGAGTKELEEELRTIKEREKNLEALLVDSRKRLLEAYHSDKSGIRAANAQRALQRANQEIEILRKENEQLQRSLQEADEKRKQDALMAQQEIQRYQQELQQRDNTIQKLLRQSANPFRLGEGNDFI